MHCKKMKSSMIRRLLSPADRGYFYNCHDSIIKFWLCTILLLSHVTFSCVSLSVLPSFTTPTTASNRYLSDVTQWLDREHVPWKILSVDGVEDFQQPPKQQHDAKTVFLQVCGNTEPTKNRMTLHLIPTPNAPEDCLPFDYTKQITDGAATTSTGFFFSGQQHGGFDDSIIHLHQDVWLGDKSAIVKCRLLARLGRSKRIFARKTRGRRINATCAMEFLSLHHLWGSTKAKYYYGLFASSSSSHNKKNNNTAISSSEELVAVATYSSRRKVLRDGITHRSHEMIRYCSQRDGHVVGGISKLNKLFIAEAQPDDIITVIDRDWGPGLGWYTLGFSTVHIMDPIVMVVSPQEPGIRRQLVGAGLRHDDNDIVDKSSSATGAGGRRLGLPRPVLDQLSSSQSKQQSLNILSQHGFFPVHDTGVERLMLLVPNSEASRQRQQKGLSMNPPIDWLWNHSKPCYAPIYYSNNTGIAAMLAQDNLMDPT